MLASGLENIRDAYQDADCDCVRWNIDLGEREYEGVRGYLGHTLEHILEKRNVDLKVLREGDRCRKVIVEAIGEGDMCKRLQ